MLCREVIIIVIFYMLDFVVLITGIVPATDVVLTEGFVPTVVVLIVRFVPAGVLFIVSVVETG